MSNLALLHCIVSGRVQGVGFRWYVEETASSLGLTGWVRNLSNGKVEIEAEGSRETLESFLTALKSSQLGANISGIETQWEKPFQNKYKSFVISY
jgi:acylphosphatase